MTETPHQSDDTQKQLLDFFDNEAIWDAVDTDAYIIKLFAEFESAGVDLLKVKDMGWNSLLHTAALWNRTTIMENLIRKGAELNVKNKNGHTPLDLAMHWGHFELGLQLQHYGGKHSCEQERDIAISQRDLAQQQIQECEAELENTLSRLKKAKQEREEFRIERDRLLVLQTQAVQERNMVVNQMKQLELTVASLTHEKHTLEVTKTQLIEELASQQATCDNAIHGWKLAEKMVVDMQIVQEECREREEEALRMRNEAIQERDVAKERARLALIDQGIAKQNQHEAERERDIARKTLLDAESEIACDKELWRKKIAKAELDRRNIQIEIDRQTEILRSENTKLEKQVTMLTMTNARQRDELASINATVRQFEKRIDTQQNELQVVNEKNGKLEENIQSLLEERRHEHRAWRLRIEAKMQQEQWTGLRTMLNSAAQTWHTLNECHQRVVALDMTSLAASALSSSSSSDALLDTESQFPRPKTLSQDKPQILPFLLDKSTSIKGSSSSPVLTIPSPIVPLASQVNCESNFLGHLVAEQKIYDHIIRLDKTLQREVRELTIDLSADEIIMLCSFIQNFINTMTDFIIKNLQHLRKQALAQEKMIERKDELIQRFNQHRLEMMKKRDPARFRDCSVRPLV